MADIYDLLLGNPDPQRMQSMADALRGRRAKAELAMLTGDPVLSPYGANQLQNIRQEAMGLAKTRAAMSKKGPLAQKIADFESEVEREATPEEIARMSSSGITIQPTPTHFERMPDGTLRPIGGGAQDPTRISPTEAAAARKDSRTMLAGLESARQLRDMVKEMGTEAWGPASRKMAALYGAMVTSLGAARGMGVLQPSEIATIQSQFIDPSSINAAFSFNPTVVAGIDAYISEMERALRRLPEEANVEIPEEPTAEESAEASAAGRAGAIDQELRKRGAIP